MLGAQCINAGTHQAQLVPLALMQCYNRMCLHVDVSHESYVKDFQAGTIQRRHLIMLQAGWASRCSSQHSFMLLSKFVQVLQQCCGAPHLHCCHASKHGQLVYVDTLFLQYLTHSFCIASECNGCGRDCIQPRGHFGPCVKCATQHLAAALDAGCTKQ